MFTNKVFVVLTALFSFCFVSGGIISSGPCPSSITVKPNFDAEEYQGIWYEYEKYPTAYFEINGKCVSAQYILQDDGTVCVKNTLTDPSTGKESAIYGFAVQVENAKFNFTYPDFDVSTNYWVLDTDYYSYGVVYSCKQLSPILHSTDIWILTRERIPSVFTIRLAENVLVRNGLSLQPLVQSVQAGCRVACGTSIEDAK